MQKTPDISPFRLSQNVTFKDHNEEILKLHDYHANHKDNLLSSMNQQKLELSGGKRLFLDHVN